MGEMTYTVINVGGGGMGGIMPIPQKNKDATAWGNYVTSIMWTRSPTGQGPGGKSFTATDTPPWEDLR